MNNDENEAKELASQSVDQVEENSSLLKRNDNILDLMATKVILAQIFTACLSSLVWAFFDKHRENSLSKKELF